MSMHDEKGSYLQEIPRASIKVLGIGGGGGNAVNSMMGGDVNGVDFIVANTDAQSLHASPAPVKLQLGIKVTKGLGAGSDPELGRRAAEEDLEAIAAQIENADILFLTGGMGGGTGTGAMPVIAKMAREMGILTVSVVTKPFTFEGRRRGQQAEKAIRALRTEVDTLIVIPNQKLLDVADPKISVLDAFAMANNVLKQAIKGVSDIIVRPGHINVDFADVKSIMKGMGLAIMGTGRRSGEGRARQAALDAISSSLIEDVTIDGARGVLINITGSSALGLQEINDAANVVYEKASEDANIILGSVIDDSMGDEILVTVIATGFEMRQEKEAIVSRAAVKAAQAPEELIPATEPVAAAKLDRAECAPKQEVVVSEPVVAKSAAEEAGSKHELAVVELEKQDSSAKNIAAAQREVTQGIKYEDRVDQHVYSPLDLSDLDTPAFLRRKPEEKSHEGDQS